MVWFATRVDCVLCTWAVYIVGLGCSKNDNSIFTMFAGED